MDYLNYGVLLFFILQLLNVILSTVKSIVTITASKHIASIVSACSYTFYMGIVKLVTNQDMIIVLSVTFITNLIGVYLAKYMLEKLQKDKVWRISTTITDKTILNEVIEEIKARNIEFILTECKFNRHILDVFSVSQGESILIKEIIDKYKIKYTVIEMNKNL